MKLFKYITVIFLWLPFMVSCKKDANPTVTVSSLNVIDASEAAPLMTINFTFNPIPFSQWTSFYGQQLPYNYSTEYANPSGSFPLELISSQDTLHPFYKNTLNFPAGSIHSLYVIGNGSAPETLLLEDHIPAYQDSVSGVRFINLCPDGQPITITLQGNPPGQTEFSNLAYKQITDFKSYSAKSAFIPNGYTFEIRDAATGSLLTTFTWYFKIFFCNTLVIEGLENDNTGNFPVTVAQVDHYVNTL